MSITHLGALKANHRLAEAKKMLLEAVSEQQKKLTGIRPSDPEREQYYNNALETLAKYRGAPLWYPYLGSGIGNGALVELMDGSVKYDFIGGIGVHHFGHGHPEIISACVEGAISDLVMQGHLQQNTDSLELIDILVTESKLDHCFLTTSGSMANENALKIAFQKNHPAKRILAFEGCFCGRTLAMSQITEKPMVREGLPVDLDVDYIPFYSPEEPEKSTKRAIETLKKFLWRHPKGYALMIFEMIQGEGGYYPGDTEFFRQIMEVLKNHNIAIVIDEVQTFGRTSKLFAFQHFGLQDLVDMVNIGKLAQVCATLFTDEYNPRPGLLSQTFTSSSAAIHASKTMIHLMIKEGFFGPNGKNMKINEHFTKNFKSIAKRHPNIIRGPYGLGAMVAFTPLDGDSNRIIQFGKNLFQAGVMSFVCGRDPTRARFLPPVGAVRPQDIDSVTKIVEETLLCS
ncbi:MAG: Acetylornithine/acetyl-lysine aminotransferase [Chlamydiae bacterium]|nr:Acetylornithine/acetyl-lysine aminotransferase [Chlamydiota bacterium]